MLNYFSFFITINFSAFNVYFIFFFFHFCFQFGDTSLSTISRCELAEERNFVRRNKHFVLAITILNIATLFFPFITLVFLNGAIVFMLKKRNIQVKKKKNK